MTWTVDDIPDQSGRTVLITGATAGIGLEVARVFAQRHAHLILACRNATKMAAVASELRVVGARGVDELVCDLSDLESVRSCTDAHAALGRPIDVLLLNAGLVVSYKPTAQGYENIVGCNHLGHFLLTGLLMPYIRGRIVIVSSGAHLMTNTIDWDVVSGKELSGSSVTRYAESKLANLLFVEELNRRLVAAGSDVVAVGANPGSTRSDVFNDIKPGIQKWLLSFLMRALAQPTSQGAWPLLMAATDEHAVRAAYYGPSHWWIHSESCGPPKRDAVKSKVLGDVELAKECWKQSEKLTSFSFVI